MIVAAIGVFIIIIIVCRCYCCRSRRTGTRGKHKRFTNIAFNAKEDKNFDVDHPAFSGFKNRSSPSSPGHFAFDPNDEEDADDYAGQNSGYDA